MWKMVFHIRNTKLGTTNPSGSNSARTLMNRIFAAMCPRFGDSNKNEKTQQAHEQLVLGSRCHSLSDARVDSAVAQIYTEMSQIQIARIRYCRLRVPCNKTGHKRNKEFATVSRVQAQRSGRLRDFSPQCPDRLWDQHSLSYWTGYRVLSRG